MQLTHYNTKFSKRTFPITLICDNVTSASNIGSLLRISDAFGVEKVIFCGNKISINRKALKTARAADKYVDFEINNNAFEVIETLINKRFLVISLEITEKSKPLHKVNFSNNKAIALVVGDENFGVSEDILKLSDLVLHIDMFGKNSSMNVVQATNIALYEITKQLM